MTLDMWAEWAGLIASLICVVGGLWAFTVWARKQFRDAVLEDVKPVIQNAIRESLAPVLLELHPNGGSSLRDSVDRLEEGHDQLQKSLDVAEAWRVKADWTLRKIDGNTSS